MQLQEFSKHLLIIQMQLQEMELKELIFMVVNLNKALTQQATYLTIVAVALRGRKIQPMKKLYQLTEALILGFLN